MDTKDLSSRTADHREDFPFFENSDVAYLDNAATSQTPQCVIDALAEYYTKDRSNIHRGLYAEAERTSEKYEAARAAVARFVGASADEIIFTAGATMSSNMLAYMLEGTIELREGDEIVVSEAEHHASLIPLQELARRKGCTIKAIPVTDAFDLDYGEAEKLIGPRTKIVSVMLASNVTGSIFDVARVAACAKQAGAIMITDATAALGHMHVDVEKLGVDFAYFSGHKMCGPTGIGVLYGRKEMLDRMRPGFFGGGMIGEVSIEEATWAEDVSRFEAGTPPIAEAIALGTAVQYLSAIGMETIHARVMELTAYAIETLGAIEGVTLLCRKDPGMNIGIVSFVIEGVHPHDVADILARERVAIRAGHHCAMPLIRRLGVQATARASLHFYTTTKDIDALCAAVRKTRGIFAL